LAVDALLFLGGVALFDLQPAQPDVAHAVERERVRRQPVAAGAADLLVVALDIGGQVGVEDEADIGLVDPHAEGDGGDDDDAILLQKRILVARANGGVQSRVIRQRLEAVLAEDLGNLLGAARERQ